MKDYYLINANCVNYCISSFAFITLSISKRIVERLFLLLLFSFFIEPADFSIYLHSLFLRVRAFSILKSELSVPGGRA